MGKEILTFGDIEIEKNKFYRNKTIFWGDIDKVLVSNKISSINTLLVTYMIIKLNHCI